VPVELSRRRLLAVGLRNGRLIPEMAGLPRRLSGGGAAATGNGALQSVSESRMSLSKSYARRLNGMATSAVV
jgi:hypothetical protein